MPVKRYSYDIQWKEHYFTIYKLDIYNYMYINNNKKTWCRVPQY